MRELGIVAEEAQAQVLADYLLTLNIPTRVVVNREGRWAIWVQHEDKVAQARVVFDEFRGNPEAPHFQAAAQSARAIRRQAAATEKQYRRNLRDFRDRWEGRLIRRAPATVALIALSVAVFLFEKFAPAGWQGLVPYWLRFSLPTVDADGFERSANFALIGAGQVWRLVTPIFLHADPLHIVFNLVALAALGQRVEVVKGWARYLLLVVLAAVVGNVGQSYLSDGHFGGMSGVVFGLAGYLWVKGEVAPEEGLGLNEASFRFMMGWFLLGIIAPMLKPDGVGFPFNMANVAHGGGLAIGLLLGLLGL